MTRERVTPRAKGMTFADTEEVQRAFGSGQVDLQARVSVASTKR